MPVKSLAIIPDGNRRYANQSRLSVRAAYDKGFQKVEEVLEWAEETDIERIAFWALSLENFKKRSGVELRVLFSLMRNHIRKALQDKKFVKKGVRVKFFGKLELLPEDLREMMRKLEEKTANGKRELGIAVAYSGREELLQAAKKVVVDFSGKPEQLNEKDFEKYLYLPQPPDLIIRTGDVSRLSGFLPWQTAYSELYFSKKLWPEFSREDFQEALAFYEHTERRFGK